MTPERQPLEMVQCAVATSRRILAATHAAVEDAARNVLLSKQRNAAMRESLKTWRAQQ